MPTILVDVQVVQWRLIHLNCWQGTAREVHVVRGSQDKHPFTEKKWNWEWDLAAHNLIATNVMWQRGWLDVMALLTLWRGPPACTHALHRAHCTCTQHVCCKSRNASGKYVEYYTIYVSIIPCVSMQVYTHARTCAHAYPTPPHTHKVTVTVSIGCIVCTRSWLCMREYVIRIQTRSNMLWPR